MSDINQEDHQGRITCPKAAKAEKRLLRLLGSGGSKGLEVQANEDVTLIRSDKREYRFDNELIASCIDAALVERQGASLLLTLVGQSHLKRLLHPDEPFRAQHSEIVQATIKVDNSQQTVRINESESPILRLYSRKNADGKTWLNELEFRAGERLRADFEKAQLQPRISANWVSSIATQSKKQNGAAEISDFSIDARCRVEKAINAIGDDLSGVALDICCFLKGLELVERERSWPPRSAKLMLRTALRALADHYGISQTNQSTRMRNWNTPDYRPSI